MNPPISFPAKALFLPEHQQALGSMDMQPPGPFCNSFWVPERCTEGSIILCLPPVPQLPITALQEAGRENAVPAIPASCVLTQLGLPLAQMGFSDYFMWARKMSEGKLNMKRALPAKIWFANLQPSPEL